ncbi:MAG TPA: hypothetical protein P5052_01735 [Candidatus Paceibacterota bacterium]|nr:hypothetical protein [Candidatus Paceibacterota bacterium]
MEKINGRVFRCFGGLIMVAGSLLFFYNIVGFSSSYTCNTGGIKSLQLVYKCESNIVAQYNYDKETRVNLSIGAALLVLGSLVIKESQNS